MSVLEIKHLFVKYHGSPKASVEDVSFKVEKGETVAILGPSGCGKTTILNVIAGILTKDGISIEGQINWGGKAGQREKIFETRMVFQSANLLPWRTVFANVAIGLEIKKWSKEKIKVKVNEILRVVGLLPYADYSPNQLSIGMRQRVNFARALVCEPDMLLMDEPFSALDVDTKKNIQQEFLRIIKEKNITTVFVSHNIQEASTMSSRIVVLSSGPATVKGIFNPYDLKLDKSDFFESEFYDE